jgi:hypothetical protein
MLEAGIMAAGMLGSAALSKGSSPDYSGETQQAINAYNEQAQKGIDTLKQHEAQGRTDITGYLSNAQKYSQPYTQAGTSALSSYMGALGLGGSQANLSAINSFQTFPGYQFAVNEALKGTQAKGAATGMTGSGAEQKELMKQATGLANQQYGDWESQLRQLSGMGQQSAEQAAQREMGAGTELSRQGQGYAGSLSELFQNMGSADANAILAQMAMESKDAASQRGLFGGVLGGLTDTAANYFGGK